MKVLRHRAFHRISFYIILALFIYFFFSRFTAIPASTFTYEEDSEEGQYNNDTFVSDRIRLLTPPELKEREIPKQIYSFWAQLPTPEIVSGCVRNWEKMNPDHSVNLVTMETLGSVIDLNLTPLPRNFHAISPANRADWVRLAILLQNGGFWVDSSFIMLDSLNVVHEMYMQDPSKEGFMFEYEPFTSLPEYPLLDTWFIAAVPHASFIKAWFLEWTRCIDKFAATDKYLDDMIQEYGQATYNNIRQKIDSPSYLKFTMALQKVLQVDKVTLPAFSSATKLPNGPYSLLHAAKGDSFFFIDQIISKWNPTSAHPSRPKFIKLRGWERSLLDLQVTQGWDWLKRFHFWNINHKRWWKVECGSIYCEYLGSNDQQCRRCST